MLRRLPFALLLAVVLAACGGDEPPAATDAAAQLDAAAAEGELVDHGCGHAFTLGTSDQTLRLSLWAGDGSFGDPPTPGTATVGEDGSWTGELVVGRDLFAQWCDDVVEAGEPEVVETARYVVSGTLTWTTEGTGNCDGPATGTLTDAAVTIDGTTTDLPDLELRNEYFGCFAG